MYAVDRLYEAVARKGPVCVGLDTAPEYLPPAARRSGVQGILSYNLALVDGLLDSAACFKVQIAYYEALGLEGLAVYAKTLRFIRDKGGLVIGDIKRGDIADTASRYARAHFDGEFEADFVTLSPYMGMDSLEPWLDYAERKAKGAFVLVKTSNKGARDFQRCDLKAGGTVARAVGDRLSALARSYTGKHGYGAFGAVMGCTDIVEDAAMREAWQNLFFLIPGYGAQGGTAADAARLLRRGNGGVVNASRSLLTAWSASGGAPEEPDIVYAVEAARLAALSMRDALTAASGGSGSP
ncbi:MAG: orotidine-5'-phosphate decarboxylase [Spirochaetaceae bacterium]|jgi:orotidine-5'-phosphate decarboxylase|nr:orotidine-5'-phosphate decarboxylase [Spirochaetaceae bacterium]